MSLNTITLRKLLQLFCAAPRQRRSLLLADIRADKAKEESSENNGGDFFGPFWADVKDHAAGQSDLKIQTELRIAANNRRARLYPILRDSFFEMWNEKMRWRNEPFELVPKSIKAELTIQEIPALVRIENTASIKIWDGSHRIMYPYFSEQPVLTEEIVRLGFWALSEALPDFQLNDFRIIDFQRRAYFRPEDAPMKGNERPEFIERYRLLMRERQTLIDRR